MKFAPIYAGFLFVFALCFANHDVVAQIAVSTDEANLPALELNDQPNQAIDDFDRLLPLDEVVLQLRARYGVQGSVFLSKTLWQVLTSYSDQQQAENVWKKAIAQWQNNQSENVPAHISSINPQYNAGRVLSQFTHGMTIQKWNSNRRLPHIKKQNIPEMFTLLDDVSIYFEMTQVWQVLMDDIQKQQEIQWHAVFLDSLDVFAEADAAVQEPVEQTESNEPPSDPITETQTFNTELDPQFFELLNKWWIADQPLQALAELVGFIDQQVEVNRYFYQTMVRFALDKKQQHYLATSHSWFAVAEQLYFVKARLSEPMFEKVMIFIEENDTWFLSKEQSLLAINQQLPEWVESSFHKLKAFYNGTTDISQADMMTVYQMVHADFNKYMRTPFRRKIQKDLEVCLNISEEFAPYPQQPIDKKQFIGCIKDMVFAATSEASIRELSGSLTKIDSQQALDRALQLPAWQIVNILYANSAENNCLKDDDQLVNPVEWTLAAESLLWFADRWPAYMHKYPQSSEINKMINQGQQLIERHNCLDESAQQLLDTQFTQMVQSWQNVKAQIRQLVEEFNNENLTQGSDINLLENVEKQSNYRVEDISIAECDAQNSCGVHTKLDSSRALFGLFPNHLLVADQLKLGTLKLCYDNVGWEQRRAASTHLNNDSVANYFGHFSFSLKGFYDDELVFERKLVDSKEYLYLFAENNDETAGIYCPLPIVGNNISTTLKEGTFGLLPNRLTFLTASRANESEILELNWSKGQEWRDKIIAEQGQVMYFNELSDMSTDIYQAYQAKAAELQDLIYQTLLARKASPSQAQQALMEAFADMQRSKALFAALNYFLQSDELMINDALHGMMFGQDEIADVDVINGFYQNQTNINLLISSIDDNLKRNQQNWEHAQKGFSHSHVASILFHLKSLKP